MIEWITVISDTTKDFINERRSTGYDGSFSSFLLSFYFIILIGNKEQREQLAIELKVDLNMMRSVNDHSFLLNNNNVCL